MFMADFTHNCPKLKTINTSSNRCTDELVHPHSGYYSEIKGNEPSNHKKMNIAK